MTDFNTGALGAAGTYGLTGTQIYQNFHAGTGDDGRGLQQVAASVKQLSDHYDRRVESITRLTTQMESAWEGDAAGAARRGAGPLAVEHARAKLDMNTAENAMTSQVDAFDGAKRTVREVPPEPEKPGLWDNMTSFGGAGRNYESQMNQVNAANDLNVAVMESYEGASQSNADRMPVTYGSLEPDHSGIGVREPVVWPPGPVTPPDRNDGDDTTSNNNSSSNNTTNNPNQNRPPSEFGTRPQGETHNPPNITTPNQFDPPGRPEPPGRPFPPVGPGPGPGQNPNLPPGMFPPGFGPGPGGNNPGGGQGGRGPGGGFGPRGGGGFGPGGGGAGAGSGAGGGSGSGAGGRGPGGFGPGGAGAAAAAEGAGARGGMGAGGLGGGGRGAGGGGMGGMGGNRGQGSEDGEHERPTFLVEPDPHETFGTDEVTAPPVIGE